jgi:hypothetical protein
MEPSLLAETGEGGEVPPVHRQGEGVRPRAVRDKNHDTRGRAHAAPSREFTRESKLH